MTLEATDVIWLQTGFLGDIVINTGAMALLRRERPHIKQHLITTGVGAAALKDHSSLDSLHVFKKKDLGTLAAFREIKASLKGAVMGEKPLLLQPHRSYRSGLLATYLGYPRVVYEETDFSWRPVAKVPRLAVWHECHRDALLLSTLGIPRATIAEARPRLDALPLTNERWEDFLSGSERVIGMAPGSVWGTKRWIPESFAEVARQILHRAGTKLVFLGGEAEKEVIADVTRTLQAPERWLDLGGETSLDDLRRVYPHLQMLISNDSSAIHYASSFDVPTVAIFGATVSGMGFGPLAPDSVVCQLSDLACRPCSDHGPQTCPLGHFKCMRDLPAHRVWREVAARLESCSPC